MRIKNSIAFVSLFCLLFSQVLPSVVYAQRPRTIIGPGIGIGNYHMPYHIPSGTIRTLSPDTTYLLTGWTFIDAGATLIIPAGTIIRGDKSSMGTLIILRGAKIIANGTVQNPIIFTSDLPIGLRNPGDWGGIVICGNAPTNYGNNTQVEGGFGTTVNSDAFYGGTNSDDSSGVFRYVRIEFPGDNVGTENEINGLTLAGVGRKTVVDHVQISFSNDDDIQFLGGTVDAKYLISWRCRDDNFGTKYGHDGRLQFLYAKRDPNLYIDNLFLSTNGIESDNHPALPASLPKTKTRISNVTLIGPAADTNASKALAPFRWFCVVSLQSGTQLSVNNGVLLGFDYGIALWDTNSQVSARDGLLQIRNTSLQARTKNIFLQSGAISGFNVVTWFNNNGNIGSTPRDVPAVGLQTNAFAFNSSNDPVPPIGTEPDVASADFVGSLFGDAWFDNSATYRGAFVPGIPMNQQWSAGWTNFDPQNYEPEVITIHMPVNTGWNLVSPPVSKTPISKNLFFPNSVGSVFSYSPVAGSYSADTALIKGTGYWAFYSNTTTESVTGSSIDSVGITISAGGKWVLFGSLSDSVSLSSLSTIPLNAIEPNVFGFNGTYSPSTSIIPGKGYWLYVNNPCTIVLKK
jgi:hypothetical protein